MAIIQKPNCELRPSDLPGEKLLTKLTGPDHPGEASVGGAKDRSAPYSMDPRHLCCRFHCIVLCRIIGFLEIVFSFILFVTVIALGCTLFNKPAVGPIIGGVTLAAFGAICAVLLLVGIHKQLATWLLPYLIFKGFQMAIVGIFLVICLLGLMGFSFIYGLVATSKAAPYEPPDFETDPWAPIPHAETGERFDLNNSISLLEFVPSVSDELNRLETGQMDDGEIDQGEAAVNQVTVFLATFLAVLMIVLFVLVFFIIIVFKSYRCLKERADPATTPSATYVTIHQPPFDNTGVAGERVTGSEDTNNDCVDTTGRELNGTQGIKKNTHVRRVSTSSQTNLPLLEKAIGSFEITKDCDCAPGQLCPHEGAMVATLAGGEPIDVPFMDEIGGATNAKPGFY